MEVQKTKFDKCLYFNTTTLARSLTRLAEQSFASTGLAPSQGFTLMMIIEQPGISPSEIAKEIQMTPSTITRFLDKLEVKGLVRRHSDGKSFHLYPTDEGLKLKKKLSKAWKALFASYYTTLGEEAASGLSKIVHDATDMLREHAL